MQTKSKIQLIKEELQLKEFFKRGINNLMESYTIEDSTFSFNGSNVSEYSKGYLLVKNEFSSIDEAMKEYEVGGALRIVGNKQFQVGKMYNRLSEIDECGKVIDITTGVVVNEGE